MNGLCVYRTLSWLSHCLRQISHQSRPYFNLFYRGLCNSKQQLPKTFLVIFTFSVTTATIFTMVYGMNQSDLWTYFKLVLESETMGNTSGLERDSVVA